MNSPLRRRSFLRGSVLAAAASVPLVRSVEEHRLLAQAAPTTPTPSTPVPKLPMGRIGKVQVSRLLCGGNLISGYAHSRDLIYVSSLLTHYFTDEKIMETWAGCEAAGINTMIAFPGDPHAVEVYRKYRQKGGKIQYFAQISPDKDHLKEAVTAAVDAGASGAFLVGNLGDLWTREGAVGRIGELITLIKAQGLVAGVAGHELRTPMMVEKAGIEPDFYMKTLHSTNYWSKRQPSQDMEVIDNYSIDNYWCADPEATIRFMAAVQRPWIAYKVLAAGAIHPRAGFKYAFGNGADFAVVGMFDFQVKENVTLACNALQECQDREREWMA